MDKQEAQDLLAVLLLTRRLCSGVTIGRVTNANLSPIRSSSMYNFSKQYLVACMSIAVVIHDVDITHQNTHMAHM